MLKDEVLQAFSDLPEEAVIVSELYGYTVIEAQAGAFSAQVIIDEERNICEVVLGAEAGEPSLLERVMQLLQDSE